MPSSTFFRLPEEKRQRLLDAARAEFKRVPFSEASINRIIVSARIPRGSFYQYFTDKDDLFHYLMSDIREHFSSTLKEILTSTNRDLFSVAPQAFDRLMMPSGQATPHLSHCVEIMLLNPNLGSDWLFDTTSDTSPEALFRQFDLSPLRQSDREFVCSAFSLTIISLAHAIMDTLRHPEQYERNRRLLHTRVDIIKNGCVTDALQGGTL